MEKWKAKEGREKEEAIDLLHKQMAHENELIRLYEKMAADIRSSPIRYLLHMMQLDSMKHVDVCHVALDVLLGEDVLQTEKKELVDGLKRHVELEKGAVDMVNKMLKNVWIKENQGLKVLIERLRDDEKNHHQALKELTEKTFFRLDTSHDFSAIWRLSHGDVEWLEERYARSRKHEKKKADLLY